MQTRPRSVSLSRRDVTRTGEASGIAQEWNRDGRHGGRCRSHSPSPHIGSDCDGVISKDSEDAHGSRNQDCNNFKGAVDELVTERHLDLLSSQIGSKLQSLTTTLGLQEADYEHASKTFKLAESQALYIFKQWSHWERRTVAELCDALEKAGLLKLAVW